MDILLKGVLSGAAVMAVIWVSRILGPRVGGLVAMLPLVTALSFIFSTYPEKSAVAVQEFSIGLFWGNMLYFLFIGALYYLAPRSSWYWGNLAVAYFAWVGGAVLYVYLKG